MMYEKYATGIENPRVSTEEFHKAESVYLMLPPSLGHKAVYAIRKALGEKDAITLFDFILNLDSERIKAEESKENHVRKMQEAYEETSNTQEDVRALLKIIYTTNQALIGKNIRQVYAEALAEQAKQDAFDEFDAIADRYEY